MRAFVVALALIAASACSPAAAPSPEPEVSAAPDAAPDAAQPAEARAANLGPYANSWNSDEFSRFRHTLHARSPGEHTLTLAAQTNAGGGETVAIYRSGPDGEPMTNWRMFVIATTRGGAATGVLEFPPDGAGVPVVVVVENAGGRRHAGSYSLTIE